MIVLILPGLLLLSLSNSFKLVRKVHKTLFGAHEDLLFGATRTWGPVFEGIAAPDQHPIGRYLYCTPVPSLINICWVSEWGNKWEKYKTRMWHLKSVAAKSLSGKDVINQGPGRITHTRITDMLEWWFRVTVFLKKCNYPYKFVSLCECVCACISICQRKSMRSKELSRVSSLLPPFRPWGLNMGHHTW